MLHLALVSRDEGEELEGCVMGPWRNIYVICVQTTGSVVNNHDNDLNYLK